MMLTISAATEYPKDFSNGRTERTTRKTRTGDPSIARSMRATKASLMNERSVIMASVSARDFGRYILYKNSLLSNDFRIFPKLRMKMWAMGSVRNHTPSQRCHPHINVALTQHTMYDPTIDPVEPLDETHPDPDTIGQEDPLDDPRGDEGLRKSVEKDIRKKYFAKVGKIAKERDEAIRSAELAQSDIESIVETKLREREAIRQAEEEQIKFFESHPDARDYEDEIRNVRDTFPAMSWQDARKFWLASHRPDLLVDRTVRAQSQSRRLDTTAYVPSRLTNGEPDISTMSATEYRSYVDDLLKSGKLTL